MAELRDQHYIEAIKTGDRAVLESIYQTMMPSLLRLIKPTGGSIDDAKDLFQDAIILIFKKIQLPDFTLTSAFSTYFYGICRNLWANQLKKKVLRPCHIGGGCEI